METIETDVLILGAGGAGLCAALHCADRAPGLATTVVVKGLLGRAGCTRMVQGGYNAVLAPPDSLEAHFLDTMRGGSSGAATSARIWRAALRFIRMVGLERFADSYPHQLSGWGGSSTRTAST